MIKSFVRTALAAGLALVFTQAAQAGTPPRYDHIVVVIMENHGLTQIVGDSSAPYITSLSTQGANFTNSHGVSHPSEPNYLAFFSGSTQGVTDDSCPHTYSGNNLGAQLAAAGLSFTGYSEDLPSVGYTGCGSNNYARKHNPWVNFSNVPSSANQPYTSFPSDFTRLPTVSVVVPNLIDDMHDGTVSDGDTWLQNNIDAYAQWAKSHNSLLILTFDEDDSSTSSNLIPTIFVGAGITSGNYSEQINHYNVLRTIQSVYGLSSLNSASAITDVFSGGGGTPNCNSGIADGSAVTCAAAGLAGYTGTAYNQVYTTYAGGGQCTQVPAPGFDTSHCVAPGNNVLSNGVPVTGLSLATNAQLTYTFNVPSGATSASFQTSGGTGDVDLYIQLGAAPTTSSYLQKSDGATTAESISLTNPTAGTYYVLLNAYNAPSGFQLVANYSTTSGGNVLTPGVAVTGLALPAGSSKVYSINVPAGRSSLTFKTSGGSGDCDIYVQRGSVPTTSSYLKKSDGSTTSESITITAPTAGTYYLLLNSYATFSGVSLIAND